MHALPPTAQQCLSSSGVKVKAVQQRHQQHIPHQQRRPNSAEALQQVQLAHRFLQRQQHLGNITSAAAVIAALPEALLCPVGPQLRPLFGALKACGFARQDLSALLTNCGRDRALDLLLLPAAEVAPRLHQLAQLLALPQEQVPGFVGAQPGLLAAHPAALHAAAAWLGGSLGWSAASLRRHSQLLLLSPGELEVAATLLQARLDLSTAELVLLLHIVPHLLAASPAELEELLCCKPTAVDLAREVSLPLPEWNPYAAQSEHLKLCMLKLCSVHGLSLAELNCLLHDKPTILREVKL